jgi:uncharacterized RDD family membrane protein YckC
MDQIEDAVASVLIAAVAMFAGAWAMRRPAGKMPGEQVAVTGTSRPKRYMSAGVDNLGALVLLAVGGIALTNIAEVHFPSVPKWILGCAGCLLYLVYFFVCEAVFSTTPGKALYGLRVVQFSGERCSWQCALIRTATRLLEVNPVLLGGLPAGIAVISSRHHQRIGDMLAGTVVTSQHRQRAT